MRKEMNWTFRNKVTHRDEKRQSKRGSSFQKWLEVKAWVGMMTHDERGKEEREDLVQKCMLAQRQRVK